ncbi:MAG: nucleotidyltransferase [Tidjanibacter sp.]|nr:nucleotidyltransferase [Tidjanibacter sp.]
MSKPTLLVLAAGMASRYGSLKQMDGVGPSGEAIIDYSIYDAARAGFGKVVFVIREAFADTFKAAFPASRFGGKIEVDFVYQELHKLPEGFSVPAERVKPWGTNHAIMMGAEVINTPFAVINADDFYGYDAFRTMAEYLNSLPAEADGKYCMVGYKLCNTLSDFGTVSRGECMVDAEGNLAGMTERLGIKRLADGRVIYDNEGSEQEIDENTTVSMNMFGFTPDYFTHSDRLFVEFLSKEENMTNLKSEFFIPMAVNHLIGSGTATMRVLTCNSQWFGVTYKEDKPDVVAKINALVEAGEYPSNLW